MLRDGVLARFRGVLICLSVIVLSSCSTVSIPVEDFGSYWAKGTVDPSLLGKWETSWEGIAPRDQEERKEARTVKIATREVMLVANQGGEYEINRFVENDLGKERGYASIARTLKVGGYTFLMQGSQKDFKDGRLVKGGMIRYTIKGDRYSVYLLNDERMYALVRAKYPTVNNIEVTRSKEPNCKKDCISFSIKIHRLDDKVHKILSEIPDTAEFWRSGDYSDHVLFMRHSD